MQALEMERVATKKISGGALRKLRFQLALTQGELGDKIGLSEIRVRQIERSVDAGVQPKVWRKLMDLTGKSLEEVEALLAIPQDDDELGPLEDLNVEPYSEVSVEEIPLFDLPIAAGVMTELPDSEEMHDPRLLKLLRFRVRIRGESMEKEYPDGSIVEFKCLQWHQNGAADKMEIGKDYYVQSQDTATFKRLAEIHDGELIFAALNKRKFPEKIRLLRENVTRMAKAVAVIRFVG